LCGVVPLCHTNNPIACSGSYPIRGSWCMFTWWAYLGLENLVILQSAGGFGLACTKHTPIIIGIPTSPPRVLDVESFPLIPFRDRPPPPYSVCKFAIHLLPPPVDSSSSSSTSVGDLVGWVGCYGGLGFAALRRLLLPKSTISASLSVKS
jgi:hypothetical protein